MFRSDLGYSFMTRSTLSSELEKRIQLLENPANQGEGFGKRDWNWLMLLGVIGPVVLLFLGWWR
jgi:hypothetical protein